MNKKLIFLYAPLLFATGSFAQTVLRGSVSSSDNRPLEEATIFNVRTGSHAHSNENGWFLLNDFRKGDRIKISHVAFRSQIVVAEKDNLQITLWKETQFATTSRLKNEANAVTEMNFTPGTPFNIKARLVYKF